jgi:alpha-glucosidase
VREIAREFRRRKIPADALYIDIDFMDGFRIFTWDKEKFPNPRKMISDLEKDGFRSIVIVNPAVKVDENFAVYREGKVSGFFVKRSDGSEFNGSVWAGNSAFIDFTNPRARAWFGAKYETFLEQGVAGFWNDMNEPSVFPTERENPVPLMNSPYKNTARRRPAFRRRHCGYAPTFSQCLRNADGARDCRKFKEIRTE